MSRLKSLYDGTTYMTPQNAQRYFIKRLSNAIKDNDYEKMQQIADQMADNQLDASYRCEFCPKDDCCDIL